VDEVRCSDGKRPRPRDRECQRKKSDNGIPSYNCPKLKVKKSDLREAIHVGTLPEPVKPFQIAAVNCLFFHFWEAWNF